MQEQDVPSSAVAVLVDTKHLEEEAPSEILQPHLTGDKTLTLQPNVDGQANAHGKNGDVGVFYQSEMKTCTKVEPSSPKTGNENAKKRKTWLLTDSEVCVSIQFG